MWIDQHLASRQEGALYVKEQRVEEFVLHQGFRVGQ